MKILISMRLLQQLLIHLRMLFSSPISQISPVTGNDTSNTDSLDFLRHAPFSNPAPPPHGSLAYSNPTYGTPNSSFLGFINRPADHDLRCPLQVLTVPTRPSLMTPDVTVRLPTLPVAADPHSPIQPTVANVLENALLSAASIPMSPPTNDVPVLHGSNYDQKLLIKFSSPPPSPPTPLISSPPPSPSTPFKSTSPFDQLEELDFLPVITPRPDGPVVPSRESTFPPTFSCRRPTLSLTPALRLGIRHTTPFKPSECCRALSPVITFLDLENANFINAIREAPFVSNSATHG
jgi:hypothetical protein